MTHPFYPQLKKDQESIQPPSKPGIWEHREFGELNALAEAMEIGDYNVEINSIPDMWARPLLFVNYEESRDIY